MKKIIALVVTLCFAATFAAGSAYAQAPASSTGAHHAHHAKHGKHVKHAKVSHKKSAHKKSAKKHHA
jgi:Ni/Co efflux regulator RcnB